jgi:hypothetical protein
MGLSCEMGEGMHALPDEVEPVWVALTVDNLEVNNPLEEELMRGKQLLPRDCTLVNDPNRADEPTEVRVIGVWKNPIEDARSQAVKIC